MTAPTPAELDQQIIDTGKQLANLERANPRDPAAIAAAIQTLNDLRAQRYPNG